MLRVERHPHGPRVWLFGVRLHHGTVALWLIAAGLILAVHDRADYRSWLCIEHHT